MPAKVITIIYRIELIKCNTANAQTLHTHSLSVNALSQTNTKQLFVNVFNLLINVLIRILF